ncbi:hypothetical protein LK468_09815 [Mycobacteroides abscessus]|uniref:hypothetical protein n=1 Tax=Mycobacteroides abscessus TaxID=36809 RepID=UPI00092AB078|nr:hypothetical protein [Mycobacteroides abscessus]UEA49144.1 hypothetical protein LK451_02785 [Mycobacteroides abscessus subsp. abscessus]UEA55050.1 hypothetical protein LK468_09815 [Mycobacteroides abscessus]SIJ95547.1 Type IV secretory pathway, VirB10 components [Mycobacteroides abscessus subsp. bolletii]SLF77612.1 Type IV secretory pathway, VirB10 components [Mycobacteroides abscessus subsp. bolletii]
MTDTDRPDGDDAPTQTLPAAAPLSAPELTGFPAGIVGAALTVLGVWGLHVLTRGDGVAGAVGWVILLCLAFSALGKGITLLRRALAPLSVVLSASVDGVPPLLRAAAGIIVGAAGIWWVMRGHASGWWAQITGGDSGSGLGWSLPSQLVQVGIMVVAGALLFGGAKVLGKLIFANSGTRQQPSPNHDGGQRWRQWWASHPGLGLTLLAGGGALVFLSGYVVPRVSSWLTGDDPMAALAAITAILTLALLANTWWWRALSGWWAWAHTPNGPGGPTPIGQIYAGAGVLALIGFSATAFGLATFSSYLPQNAATASADPCGDRCGGGGNGQGSYGPDTGNFQPPQMPGQQPDYQGGINQPPLDQNSGISIYNEGPGQGGQQIPQTNMGPQTSGQRAAHGEPLPNYGPWQPDAQPPAQAPVQQAPVQQAPQAPQQPAQAPQNPAGQQPAQQAPQQPAPQAPQQPAGQQPAQQNPPQQGQPGQQQPQNPANQQTPQQQPQKEPDTPKKNPMDPTDLATAATRRGSQQAGQQAAQQAGQQGAQQAAQQTTQGTQQATQQGAQKPVESGEQFPADFHMGQLGDGLSKTGKYANTGTHWAPDAKVSTMSKSTAQNLLRAGEKFTWLGRGMEVAKAGVDLANGAPVPETVGSTVGSLAGAWAGAEGGAIIGASIGSFFPGPGTVIGGAVGGVIGGFVGSGLGSEVGKAAGGAVRAAGSALSKAGGAVASFFGSL